MSMMGHMKYIIFKGDWGLSRPVIFDSGLSHMEMVRNVIDPLEWETETELKHKILSAGFVILTDDGIQCYGRSETLDLGSREEQDSNMINRMLGRGEH